MPSLADIQRAILVERETALRVLGVGDGLPPPLPALPAAAAAAPRKRGRAVQTVAAEASPRGPTRRSQSRPTAVAAAPIPAGADSPPPILSTPPFRAPAAAEPGKLKSFACRLTHMASTHLGRHVPVALAGEGNKAKAAVLWEACGARPPFNRYSGCQELRDALVLFVNVEAGGQNEFSDGGRRVTWFASPSRHARSNDVLRLAHHAAGLTVPAGGGGHDRGGDDSAAGSGDDTSGPSTSFTIAPARVALACRVPGEPYVWCGELQLESVALAARPIKFTWRLRDWDALAPQPAFQALLRAAKAQ